MNPRQTITAITGLLFASALAFYGQQVTIEPRAKPAPKERDPRSNIRIETNLVLVPVTVGDTLNRPVLGLEKENFRVFDDKVEQTITQFAMEDEPIAVGLVFDTSGSMGATLQRSRMAAIEFFKTANPEDEFTLVEFDNSPRLVVPLTTDTSLIENKLLFSRSKGSTALVDAIYLALHEVKKSKKNKKALLIISDGGDNHSRYTVGEIRQVLRESDLLIYSIGVFGGGVTPEERSGPDFLGKISEQSGGRLLVANRVDLPDIATKIGIELRNRYVLGYSPKNQTRDGRYHHIKVQVISPRGLPRLNAQWRTGYYAPTD